MWFKRKNDRQKPNPDRNNRLCDIKEDDEIEDKSEVTVLLIPVETNATESLNSIKSEVDMESFVEVLYTEPVDKDNNIIQQVILNNLYTIS